MPFRTSHPLAPSALARQRLTETSLTVAEMKQRMIASAALVVVLADSSKFAHVAVCEVCPLTRVQTVITDSGLAAEQRQSGELEFETILVEPIEA